MSKMKKYEKDNYRIDSDERLLLDRNIELVRKRSEHLAKWAKSFIKKNSFNDPMVLSVGCGLGFDVVNLIDEGISCKGIEPVDRRNFWKNFENVIENLENTFAVASDRNIPFEEKFDFIFAFEVLEHVGTVDNETKVGGTTYNRREEFICNLLKKLNHNGILVLTCPNKLFPIDFAHGHSYIPFASYLHSKFQISPTIPWARENFLPSPFDIKKILKKSNRNLNIEFIKDLDFFSFTRSKKNPIKKIFIIIFKSLVLLSRFLPVPSPHIVAVIKLKQ